MSSLILVSERWCDGNPAMLLSDTYQTYYKSAIACKLFDSVECLYPDESFINGKHIDDVLLERTSHPDYYAFTYIGDCPSNPTTRSLAKIGGKKIFLWQDTVWPWIYKVVNDTNPYADLHTCFDFPDEKLTNLARGGLLSLPAPQCPSLFYPEAKDIPVSFMGSTYSQRIPYLQALSLSKIPVTYSPGKRISKMPIEEYAKLLRRSAISIGMPSSPSGKLQLKNRVFESLACGCLLLEGENPFTRERLHVDKEYVEYTTPKDLLEKIEYYTMHEEERNKIAAAGLLRYLEDYSPVPFWSKILNNV